MIRRRWRIAGLVAFAAIVAGGPFLVVRLLRASREGPRSSSPNGLYEAEVLFGDRLCRIRVLKKRGGSVVASGIAKVPGKEDARLVWTPESDAVGYVAGRDRLLGFARVGGAALREGDKEVADRILARAAAGR